MSNKLINTEIKGRDITFFLTTKSDLEAIKSKNIFADAFLLLFSLTSGGLLSVYFTKILSDNISEELMKRFDFVILLLAIISGAFLIFYIIFTCQSFKAIQQIISSGKVTSINISTDPTEKKSAVNSDGLKILEALYYTDKGNNDPTQMLRSLVVDNTLKTFANNDLSGDPHPGQVKKLRIKYSYDGVVYEKVYNEGDPINLP